MKKILQVVSCLALGGTEAFIMNNYRALDRTQYQFDFAVFVEMESPYVEEIKSLGGKVFYVGLPSVKNYRRFEKKLRELVAENGPYIAVHSHVNIQNSLVLKAADKVGIHKRISHSHDTSGKDGMGLRKAAIRWKDGLIKKHATDFLACSVAAGNYLYGCELFSAKGMMIPNGIDLAPFLSADNDPVQLRERFSIPSDCDLIVGNITRFEPKKNPLFTVRVFSELLKYFPRAVLLLGGPDGGQLEETIQLVNTLNISDHVRFIGPRRDIPNCLKLIDIYLFPSLYEGLGIAFLEAQAAGCFCVASDGVAKEASVIDTSTIYLELSHSAADWAAEIEKAYKAGICPSAEEIRREFREKGFEIQSSHEMLMGVYDRA